MSTLLLLSLGFVAGFVVAACFQVGAAADGWRDSAQERAELERIWKATS